mmetsp:Transcript_4526/g.9089  ORF Transcript_4526/g.9089 Transcript_4526/m.9089 type:complete len:81 (-) Transcript_4526:117-359(-)|eukprot:CAMPEP_0181326790 /NCGR_PEP_ID=MMETSP1101-20121128/21713_1 /TAXON_ID=46948 /ORGANISM="Rhodomonas abbreviata, Strain Caron Lab Isolate" /LENGTH=80 /DNA_ID=CAMNT_0023435321 /DNA_START=36 /DNA_END=278 /DNA_ORIENTATION=+
MFGLPMLPSTNHWSAEQGYEPYTCVFTPACPSCPHGYYTISDYPTFGGQAPQGTPEPNLGYDRNNWQTFESARNAPAAFI